MVPVCTSKNGIHRCSLIPLLDSEPTLVDDTLKINPGRNHVDIFCTIFLPVFNEERSVVPLIASIRQEMDRSEKSYEILVVDDGSTDATAAKLREFDGIRVITHPTNLGYGASIKTGVQEAKGERILLMDADSSYPAELIRRMLDVSTRCDMVVGARKQVFIRHFLARGILRYLFKVVTSVLVGTWIPDLNSGMRVVRTDLARQVAHLLPDGFSASSTLTVIFMRNNRCIEYQNIPYRTRIGISKLKVVRDGLRFLRFVLFQRERFVVEAMRDRR